MRKSGFISACNKGAFNKLQECHFELVQNLSRKSSKIYAERYWGDCGLFICVSICRFDLKKACRESRFTFFGR
jgi:hypothetical protein